MAEIVLDGLELRSLEEVHDRFAQALALPEWYGRNLDALFDCLTDRRETYEQLDLLAPQRTEESAKLERLESAIDSLRKKYGSQVISFGETSGKEVDEEK